MIGGKIKQVFKRPDKLSILVRDDNGDELVIDAAKDDGIKMLPGDSLWWQDRVALWTAQTGIAIEDVHIPRVGYSYSFETLLDELRSLCKAGICTECGCAECMADGDGQLWCPRCDGSYDLSEVK